MSENQPPVEEGMASEFAEERRSISIAEFFEKNKHMLGFGSEARSLVTAVKEAVDNSLDACSEARIFPDLKIEIEEAGDYYRLTVRDNGPGITKDQVPKVFGKLLYGSRFGVREMSRGQQGIGISAAVLYSQLTSGKPAKIISKTGADDPAKYFELTIDTDTNEPEIKSEEVIEWDEVDHGTKVELEMDANLRSRSSLHDYVQYTAVTNPYARIEFIDPRMTESMVFERSVDELPKETKEIKPHPHGVELGTVMKMMAATDSYSVSGFLQNEFTKVGSTSADKVITEFHDREYGRELQWGVVLDDDNLVDAITDAVNGKPPEATTAFAEDVAEDLLHYGKASGTEIADFVAGAADRIEDNHDVRFGDTVRENAVTATLAAIHSVRPTMDDIADAATSTRKTEQDVRLFASKLVAEFSDSPATRYTHSEIESRVDRAANQTENESGTSFGDTVRENAVTELWERTTAISVDPPKLKELSEDRDKASNLMEAMKAVNIHAPSSDCLSPIGADNIESGLRSVFDGAEFYSSSTRDAGVHNGDPFIVEAGIAYGGDLTTQDSQSVELLRFANRVPLVYQRGGCAITSKLKDMNWNTYRLSQSSGSLPKEPAVFMVHVASTNVPFTSESKDAVAAVPEIEKEIKIAVQEAARELRSYKDKQKELKQRQEKEDAILKNLPDMAEKLGAMLGKPSPDPNQSTARIMNNVYLNTRVTDDAVTVDATNYGNSGSESLTVEATVDTEPESIPDNADLSEDSGGFRLRWDVDVSAGDTESTVLEVPVDADIELDYDNIEAPKVNIND